MSADRKSQVVVPTCQPNRVSSMSLLGFGCVPHQPWPARALFCAIDCLAWARYYTLKVAYFTSTARGPFGPRSGVNAMRSPNCGSAIPDLMHSRLCKKYSVPSSPRTKPNSPRQCLIVPSICRDIYSYRLSCFNNAKHPLLWVFASTRFGREFDQPTRRHDVAVDRNKIAGSSVHPLPMKSRMV
jgi:hypothetical protein